MINSLSLLKTSTYLNKKTDLKPKRIILLRHAESQGNEDHSIYATIPDPNIELTETGKQQAFAVGKEIKIIVGEESLQFYISPYLRTRQTFKYMLQTLEPKEYRMYEDPRIREQDWGAFRKVEELKSIQEDRYKYGSFYYRFPGGESGADVFDRVSTFLETIHRAFAKDYFPQNVIIVSHGLAIRLFLMRWFHYSVEQFQSLENLENAQYILMELQPNHKYQISNPPASWNL